MVGPDFSLQAYDALLRTLRGSGYAAKDFADADPAERHLVLRHDIDMSIQAALPMAETERALNMPAAYFVLVRTEMYNPASQAGTRDLRALAAMGHTVGLHLDASLYADAEALEAGAEQECRHLEDILGQAVTLISFHRPARHLVGNDGLFAGRRHAYMSRYTRDMGYSSDSRGGWHHGHPLDHPAIEAGTALQLLTHPIWWVGQGRGDPVRALEEFIAHRIGVLKRELGDNCLPYKDYLAARQDPAEAES